MPVAEVISKICEHAKISEDEVKAKIKAKLDSLNGLVSDEGAAYIIANELGVKLFEQQTSNKVLKISEVLEGAKSVDTVGKVTRIFPVRSFTRDGQENKVGNFMIADETAEIKVVLWDARRIEWLEDGTLQPGTVVKIKSGYVRVNNYQGRTKEVHVGAKGQLIIDTETKIEVEVPEQQVTTERSGPVEAKIEAAAGGGSYKFRGTVVRAFPPNFYDACPECNKKVVREGDKGRCAAHGEVKFVVTPILNFVIDDGTENIRCTAFRELAEKIVGSKGTELQELGQNSKELLQERVDTQLLGQEMEVEGFVKENKQFNRIELSLNSAGFANPITILKKLNKGGD